MVLALDLLILFLFSIHILSYSDCWKRAGVWAVQEGREGGDLENINIKACVFVHFVRCWVINIT